MKRLALTLAVLGLCATASACDGSRGLTEPASRVQNIGTSGSGLKDGTAGDGTTTTQNIGTIGSGHREDTAGNTPVTTQNLGMMGSGLKADTGSTQDNGGTSGSGHITSMTADSISVTTQNIGTMGSGH